MAKTVVFQVINNRMRFKCGSCGARRNSTVPKGIRRKSVRCHNCGTITRCILNRRADPRGVQGGKVTMITNEGKEVDVNIHDISRSGIGLIIPIKVSRARKIVKGQEVRFNCRWNPRLIGSSRFVVMSNDGQRIGVKKIL